MFKIPKITIIVPVYNVENYIVDCLISIDNQKLIESEENLRKAQKVSNIGSWNYNIKTKEIKWSDEVYKIFEIDKNMLNLIADRNPLKFNYYTPGTKIIIKSEKYSNG